MVRHKSTPSKKPRRVALMPASNSLSSPLLSSAMPGVNTYKNAVDNLAAKYGVGDEDPLDHPAPRKKPRRKRKKVRFTSPEFVINKGEEALIEAATHLQHQHKRRRKSGGKKTKGAKRDKIDLMLSAYKAGKRANKKSVCFDKRTTLQSLLRKIPDARKPLSTWLK